ncbi:MAG: 3-deoxy-7-phosphoheptulonate synthase, partial [Eubacterium sp.]|nr:3-deoxy-7-phosphoheptulonate synthase [Eubacterium sp.]
MIVVLKSNTDPNRQNQLIEWFKNMNLGVHISVGENSTVLGLIGDTSKVDPELVKSLDIVETVKRVSETFKCCNRKFHPEDTVIEIGGSRIGGGHFCIMAGPCS